nr:MAG TPA: hypothetical protein [Caudoviricetes sp.]
MQRIKYLQECPLLCCIEENVCWTGYELTYHNARKLPELEDKKPLG